MTRGTNKFSSRTKNVIFTHHTNMMAARDKKRASKGLQSEVMEVSAPGQQPQGTSGSNELLDLVRKQAAAMEAMSTRLVQLEDKLDNIGHNKTPKETLEERVTARMVSGS